MGQSASVPREWRKMPAGYHMYFYDALVNDDVSTSDGLQAAATLYESAIGVFGSVSLRVLCELHHSNLRFLVHSKISCLCYHYFELAYCCHGCTSFLILDKVQTVNLTSPVCDLIEIDDRQVCTPLLNLKKLCTLLSNHQKGI